MTEKLDILIFAAHPDDAEIGMGGTIAKQVSMGYTVGICDLTQAECSSNGNPEIRQLEASLATERLGIHFRSNLGLPDRGISPHSSDQIAAMVNVIRLTRPAVVFAPYIVDRHPDHEACGKMVKEAIFNAKLRKINRELEAWTVSKFNYYFINDTSTPDFVVDISSFQETKMYGLMAYASQFTQPSGTNDYVATPLNHDYLERVQLRDRMLGLSHQLQYAEGFISSQPYVIERFI